MKTFYLLSIFILISALDAFSETPINPNLAGNSKFLLDSILYYEVDGFMTLDSTITPNDSTYFSIIEKSYYTYSPNYNLIEDLEVYPVGDYANYWDTKFTFNSKNEKINDSVFYKDSNDVWKLLQIDNYQYDDKNLLRESDFLRSQFSSDLYETKTSYLYDSYDSIISAIGQELNLNDLIYYNFFKYSITYENVNHNKLKDTSFDFVNNYWAARFTQEYLYDTKNNLTKIINYYIDSGVSSKIYIDSMIYNDKGFKIEEYQFSYFNDTINKIYSILNKYVYDENGNPDSNFIYHYQDSTYVLRNVLKYFYHQIQENFVEENNLNQNIKIMPIPASDRLDIYYFSNNDSPLSLKIYNSLGNIIQIVNNIEAISGENHFNLDLTEFNPGFYYFTLKAGDFIETKKFVVVK